MSNKILNNIIISFKITIVLYFSLNLYLNFFNYNTYNIYIYLLTINNLNICLIISSFIFFIKCKQNKSLTLLLFVYTITSNDILLQLHYHIKLIINTLFFGLASIHPPLFYYTLLLIIVFKYSRLFFFRLSTYIFIIYNIFIFCFGGFWSLFYFLWGFYWVYDIIEFFPLLFSLLLLILIHSVITNLNFSKINYYLKIILLYLYITRLGFFNTRHSFFKDSSKLNNLFFFSSYLIINLKRTNINTCRKFCYSNILFLFVLLFSNWQWISIYRVLLFF